MHNRYVHHGHMCQGQESMHRTCIQTSRSRMIHTLMHQSQGPGSQICASYTHRSESGSEDHRYICASYTHASESRIKEHRYVHHIHMYQSQGSRNIDKCIIHICVRIMDKFMCIMVTCIRVKNHTYMHASGSRSGIIDMCIIHTVKDWGTLINAS